MKHTRFNPVSNSETEQLEMVVPPLRNVKSAERESVFHILYVLRILAREARKYFVY